MFNYSFFNLFEFLYVLPYSRSITFLTFDMETPLELAPCFT